MEYPLKSPAEQDLISIREVSRAVVEGDPGAIGSNNRPIDLKELLLVEPYANLKADILQQLFNGGTKVVSDKFLYAIAELIDYKKGLFIDMLKPSRAQLADKIRQALGGDIEEFVCVLQSWRGDSGCEPTGDVPNLNELSCIVPAYPLPNDGSQSVACDIALHSDNGNVNVLDTTYTYMVSLTPIVTGLNRTRGGTGGGSVIEITGMGLADAEPEVTIAGVNCNVTSWSDDKIVCQTGPSPSTVRAQVIVNVPGKGYAISDGVEFFYVDLWSSNFTWGGGPLPEAGDFIVIKRGQTVYLDTVTPVLSVMPLPLQVR